MTIKGIISTNQIVQNDYLQWISVKGVSIYDNIWFYLWEKGKHCKITQNTGMSPVVAGFPGVLLGDLKELGNMNSWLLGTLLYKEKY